MEISFDDKDIREICEFEEIAVEKLGAALSRILQDRIADIGAADFVMDLPTGNPRPLNEKNIEYMIDLDQKHCLVFGSNLVIDQGKDKIDWNKVSRIKLLKIIDSEQ